MVTASALQTHLRYTAWASRRMLDAVAQLSAEELTRDFGTADRSVLGTLFHVFAADRIWLARMQGAPPGGFVAQGDHCLALLLSEWPGIHEEWIGWADGLTDESAQFDLSYADLKGRQWKQPVWQLVLHVVNHATHHRGQAAGFLRTLGHAPPPLDLVFYYRQE